MFETVANRFKVGEQIASRPNCNVYSASDNAARDSAAANVVIKFFTDTPEVSEAVERRYESEVAALIEASTTPPSALAKIYAGGVEDGVFYLVMEALNGKTLRETLKAQEDGRFELHKAITIAEKLAAGLQLMHDSGIYHGHLDSRAILIDGDEVKLAGYCPKTVDKLRMEQTSMGRQLVDPAYIAPEQISSGGKDNSVDHRADIYSLSVIIFEMVTGKKPFPSKNPIQAAIMRLSEDPPSAAELNPELSTLMDAAIFKGLSREPEDRFQHVTELIDTLSSKFSDTTTRFPAQGRAGLKEVPVSPSQAGRMDDQTLVGAVSSDAIKGMLAKIDSEGSVASKAEKTPALSDRPVGDSDSNDEKTATPEQAVEDEDQTIVGQAGAVKLPASLMFVGGPERGKRVSLDQEQMIIGSDSGCQIVVSGKEVPARYAILISREDNYYLAALSADGLDIGGNHIEGNEEILLARGDTISVGKHQLRFVEPGEVFTLNEDAADRVLDRPQSKVNSIVKIATAALAVICLLVFFVYQQSNSDRSSSAKRKAQAERAKRTEVIAKLRLEGDTLFKEGKLIEPVGANARTRFDQILELDPDDTYAKRRIAEISDRLVEIREKRARFERNAKEIERLLSNAKQYLKQKSYFSPPGANAKDAYEAVLKLDPDNETAKIQLKRIDSLFQVMVGEVNALLAKAKEYGDKGQIVSPSGENAFDTLKTILAVNPDNIEAKDLLLDLAAKTIYQGDLAKSRANADRMKKAYLTAKVLGVDPEYLAPRLRGLDLIRRSSSKVIIYDGKADEKKPSTKTSSDAFLDSAEVEKRVAALKLEGELKGVSEQGRVRVVK
jgi:serine/threonine protein kinase